MHFGSARLGVAAPDADIDVVVLVAKHIERRDFFSALVGELIAHPSVSELHPVKEARVPVVKLKWSGIDMDVLFARLALAHVPETLTLTDDSLLRNMDEQSVLSLNGCRVAESILALVPDVDNFRLALRYQGLGQAARDLLQRVGLLCWRFVSAAGGEGVPTLPQCTAERARDTLLPRLRELGVATTRDPPADPGEEQRAQLSGLEPQEPL
jgi:hypothetical protein